MSEIVKIIDGGKPPGFTQLSWMIDLKKKYGIMLHTICNLETNWWGVEFVRKADNIRKCVVFYDRMELTPDNELEVFKTFWKVEQFFGISVEDSKYANLRGVLK